MAIEKDILIPLPDGEPDAVVIQPAAAGAWPGILYLTDIAGLRPAQRKAAARLSDEGYVVLIPNIFYRVAKPPVMDMPALRANPELFMARMKELTAPLDSNALDHDAKGYINYLGGLDSVKDSSKLGVLGFCFSGGFAMRVAASCPEQVVAAASFHGGGLCEDKPTSPHHLLPDIKARLLFGHAAEDRSMPPEAIAGLERALKEWGGHYESETYAGTKHGWTTLDNPAYDQPQAEKAFTKITELFSQALS